MIFISFNDIPNNAKISMISQPKSHKVIEYNVKPYLSPDIIKWFCDNKIEYEIQGVDNWSYDIGKDYWDGVRKLWDIIGINFTKPSDAVLFKLRWL